MIWFAILMLAMANGVLRESVLVPLIGAPTSLVLSGTLLSLLILCVAYLLLPWLKIHRPLELWLVGLGWLAMTLVFELSFGFWQGKSWSELLDAYAFKGGNIWVVVLAVTALAPRLAARLRGWGELAVVSVAIRTPDYRVLPSDEVPMLAAVGGAWLRLCLP